MSALTNAERAASADAALKAYLSRTSCDCEDCVGDLLADLMHRCDCGGLSFAEALHRAYRDCDVEVAIAEKAA
jgi:phage/plasmid primase-like uncharacterized protein